ncbi:MAG: LysR family transcriptional regulator [Sphingopyxis sp.]|jgi:LysR family glycine cleavage system transcriptional activator|nr:LysR family transcriptional regulator [Sphingopyxis sp.]
MKRTHLPLNALRVFDAAARHLSFTRAADELAVTPAAVGQQIRALEDVLGVVLFRRTPKGLELTREAEGGLAHLRDGFLAFEESVQRMQAGQSSKVLTIAAPRDVTSRWLVPQIARCQSEFADTAFVLVPADNILDFTEANLDLAIVWGAAAGHTDAIALAPGGLIRIAPAHDPEATGRITWSGEPADAPSEDHTVLSVGDAGGAVDAVAAGLGFAVVPALLANVAISEKRVCAVGEAVASDLCYWLTAPAPQWRQRKVRAIVTALTTAEAPQG